MADDLPEKPKRRIRRRDRADGLTAPEPYIAPWGRPPIPDNGDSDPFKIYQAVGQALSHWECLELQLAGLFHELVSGIGNPHASHRAYGAVTIWNIRRDMLRAATESHFADFPNEDLQKQID